MKKEHVVTALVAGGLVAGVLLYRKALGAKAEGSLELGVMASGKTATAKAITTVTSGTAPITVEAHIEVWDMTTGELKDSENKTCTSLKPGDKCVVGASWTYDYEHKYRIYARSRLKNVAGEKTLEKTEDWVAPKKPATPPSGTIEIKVEYGKPGYQPTPAPSPGGGAKLV